MNSSKRGVRLRLFVSGESMARSRTAVEAVEDLVRSLAPRTCDVEVVDVLEEPDAAVANDVAITPTVDRLAPGPARRVVGDVTRLDLAGHLGLDVSK